MLLSGDVKLSDRRRQGPIGCTSRGQINESANRRWLQRIVRLFRGNKRSPPFPEATNHRRTLRLRRPQASAASVGFYVSFFRFLSASFPQRRNCFAGAIHGQIIIRL